MIDLHFHPLPFLDDGPESWDEAVELCRRAGEEGTTAIVATPHVLRDPWINDDEAVRNEAVLKLNTLLGGSPAILPGCEYWFSSDAVELWEMRKGPLVGLNRGPYLLVEFSSGGIPDDTDAVFHELALLGVVPIVAHPERNLAFVDEPERLERLVARGAVSQLTAGSLLGEFGVRAHEAAYEMMTRGLVHLVGSDAHNLDRRPPRLAAARKLVEKEWGETVAKKLFEDNPRAVVEGRRANLSLA